MSGAQHGAAAVERTSATLAPSPAKHEGRTMKPRRVFLLIGIGHVVGTAAGVGMGLYIYPSTGEFGDAFRWPLAVVFGLIGFMLSGIYSAWLCSRHL